MGLRIVIFGATGWIGQGVLQESLASPHVERVLSIGRRNLDLDHPKLRQIVHDDFENFEPIADELVGLDACFWCLGTSSVRLDEATYTRITYDFTMAAARALRERSPDLCFCFVSGAGTDDTGKSRTMWARVKGKTENALRAVGFRELFLFRPAFVRPIDGFRIRSTWMRILLPITLPVEPLLRKFGGATSATEIGRAMINAALGKSTKQMLDSRDINELAAVK